MLSTLTVAGARAPVSVTPLLTRCAAPALALAARRWAAGRRAVATLSQYHHKAPMPTMSTTFPGPEAQKLREEMGGHMDDLHIATFIDYEHSHGCYAVDIDRNEFLDCVGAIASLPLGYNHPALTNALTKAMSDPDWKAAMAHRSALAVMPPTFWPRLVKSVLLREGVRPAGMTHVQTMMCGSCSNENAMKAVFLKHKADVRGGRAWTEEELASCMENEEPGSPNLAILSFTGAFHGRMMGSLSCTRSKAVHKLDIPAFKWPVAPFPQVRYPMDENRAYNEQEEARALAEVEAILKKHNSGAYDPTPSRPYIAGVIIEPIQGEGGDAHASPAFFRGLRRLTREYKAAFVVDEVQTGLGATGRMWAHEHWQLEDPPDIVTFAKKAQTAGYFYSSEFKPQQPYRIFNTWYGDPFRLLQCEVVLDTIEKEHLLEGTERAGRVLRKGLEDLQAQFPDHLTSARGLGTYCAVGFDTPDLRDLVQHHARNRGLLLANSGVRSVRFRPPLIFTEAHAEVALDILHDAVAQALSEYDPHNIWD